jgi:hypothetical protein
MFGGPLKILVCQCTGHRENDFASSITFGERQTVAQPIARRWLVSLLINKDFRDCPLSSLVAIVLQLP